MEKTAVYMCSVGAAALLLAAITGWRWLLGLLTFGMFYGDVIVSSKEEEEAHERAQKAPLDRKERILALVLGVGFAAGAVVMVLKT